MPCPDASRASVHRWQLGDSNVGKSSLVLRFVKNQFNADQVTTVGAAFLQCPVPMEDSDEKIQFGIWDTAGSERYKALAPMVRRILSLGSSPLPTHAQQQQQQQQQQHPD